jgi:putative flippase GtrA
MNKFLRFIFVGIVAAIVDLGTLGILSNFTGMNQYLAVTLGYILGLLCNFYLSKIFTFKVQGNSYKQFLVFVIVSLLNLVFTLLIVTTPIVFMFNKLITFRN